MLVLASMVLTFLVVGFVCQFVAFMGMDSGHDWLAFIMVIGRMFVLTAAVCTLLLVLGAFGLRVHVS